MGHFSVVVFKIVSLTFSCLIVMQLCVNLFELIPLGVSWASWMCRLIFFKFWKIKFKKILTIISLNVLPFPFSHSCPLGVPFVHMLIYLMVFHRSLRLCSFFSPLFFWNWITSINFLQAWWFSSCQFESAAELLYWIFHFSYCTFQIQNILYLMRHSP